MSPREGTEDSLGALLARHGLHLSRDRGQNFLSEPRTADRLAELAGVEVGDSVIEVGTGLGALTRALVGRGACVTTVEIDSGLVRALEAESLLPTEVRLLHRDALDLDWAAELEALPVPRRVVANLPYGAATPLLRVLLDHRHRLVDWSVMVQREVALRVEATAGSRDYGSLAVLHHLCCRVERLMDLSAGHFFPAPQVSSRFVRMTPRADSPLAPGELLAVEPVVRAVFNQRRKTVLNGLRIGGFGDAAAGALEVAGIDPGIRPAEIPPESFLALSRAISSMA